MRKFFILFFVFYLFFPFFVFAENGKKKALYFYSENCLLCSEVDEYFEKEGVWEKFEIKKIEVSGPYNMDYLNEFFDAFGVSPEKRGWPVVFFDSEIIVGSQPIMDNFVSKISLCDSNDFPTPQKIKESLEIEKKERENKKTFQKTSIAFFLGAAFIDGISPCSFGVMIIFLSFMLLIRKDRRSLFLGSFFVLGVFIFYFLLGVLLGKFSLGIFEFSRFFSLSASLILIFIGSLKLRGLIVKIDKFNLRKMIKGQNFWKRNEIIFKKIFSNPWINFLTGFLTGYFLISCSYRPYFFSVQSVSQESFLKFLAIVFLYDFIFILPLILLLFVIFSGCKNNRIDAWENRHSRLVSMITGVVLLFVGIYLIQNWI